MTLTRRDFLRRSSLAIAGGLIVGDAALDLMERLTHRKVFALGPMPFTVKVTTGATGGVFSMIVEEIDTHIAGVVIDGLPADRIEELGIGPTGGRMVRASSHLGPYPVEVIDGHLVRNQLPNRSVMAHHAQLENGSWPTSPIVTTRRPVTRQPDILRFAWDGKVGPIEMRHPLPGSTPMRYNHKGQLLREAASTNYAINSGRPWK